MKMTHLNGVCFLGSCLVCCIRFSNLSGICFFKSDCSVGFLFSIIDVSKFLIIAFLLWCFCFHWLFFGVGCWFWWKRLTFFWVFPFTKIRFSRWVSLFWFLMCHIFFSLLPFLLSHYFHSLFFVACHLGVFQIRFFIWVEFLYFDSWCFNVSIDCLSFLGFYFHWFLLSCYEDVKSSFGVLGASNAVVVSS